jgi:hypothetical protein
MAQKRLTIRTLMGGLLLIHCHLAMGQCAVENMLKGDVSALTLNNSVRKPWYAMGKVWIQDGNARSEHNPGWNDVYQSVSLKAKTGYALEAFVRTSHDNGLIGFRGGGLTKHPLVPFKPQIDFRTVRLEFTPTQDGRYEVFVGFTAIDKDARLEVKTVRLIQLSGGCADNIPGNLPGG